jgi:hypothetical protein
MWQKARHMGEQQPSEWQTFEQGDQIGRIFACWAIVFVGQLF